MNTSRISWHKAACCWVKASELAKGRRKSAAAVAAGLLGVPAALAQVHALPGQDFDVSGQTITSTVTGTPALSAAGGTIHGTNTTVVGNGAFGGTIGALVSATGRIDLTGGSVTTTGSNSSGLESLLGTINSNSVNITTSGAGSYGAFAGGGQCQINLTGGTITVHGAADGLFANSSGTITGDSIRVFTDADASPGAYGALGGHVDLTNSSLTTSGTSAYGAYANQGGQITQNGGLIATSGAMSSGVAVLKGGGVALTSVTVMTSGTDAAGLEALSAASGALNTIQVSGGRIQSAQSSAIRAQGALLDVTFTNGAQISGGNGLLVEAFSDSTSTPSRPSTVRLSASGNVALSGDVQAAAGSVANVSLASNSTWTGAARNAGDVSLTDSRWMVTGNSDVASLSLDPSAIVFAAPTSGVYKTLTVRGDYASGGIGSTVQMNTVLNAGGPLSNQQTDRLLIEGNASGATLLNVTNFGGLGANTASGPNGHVNSEGISLVQVGGASSAAAFQLAGDYVTAGTAFQYHLHAYGPASPNGAADGSQSLVSNTTSNWDYRLQSEFVDPNGPTTPPNGPTTPPNGPTTPPAGPTTPPAAGGGGGNNEVRREVAPQVPAYISAPTALFNAGLLQLDSLHARLGEIRDDQTLNGSNPGEVFVRPIGGHADYQTNRSFTQYGYDFSQNLAGVTLGANGKVINDGRGTLRLGLAGVYTYTSFTPAAVDGQSTGLANYMGLAGMATWQDRQGWYIDAILAGGWYEGHVSTSERGQTAPLRGSSVATSLEAGYPFALGWQQLVLEPQVQVVYQHLSLNQQTDVDGINVNVGSQNQAVLRAGVRLARPFDRPDGSRLTPYVKLNVLQGLTSGGTIPIGRTSFTTGSYGTAMQLGVGLTGTLTPRLSLYGNVTGQHEIASGGFNGWAVSGGLRYTFW